MSDDYDCAHPDSANVVVDRTLTVVVPESSPAAHAVCCRACGLVLCVLDEQPTHVVQPCGCGRPIKIPVWRHPEVLVGERSGTVCDSCARIDKTDRARMMRARYDDRHDRFFERGLKRGE